MKTTRRVRIRTGEAATGMAAEGAHGTGDADHILLDIEELRS